jgi:hypothetical protein
MLDEFLLRTFCYQNPRTNRGSLLNRIDVHIKFPYLDYEKLSGDRVGELSESVCVCVQAARDIQRLFFIAPVLDKRDIRSGLGGGSGHWMMRPPLLQTPSRFLSSAPHPQDVSAVFIIVREASNWRARCDWIERRWPVSVSVSLRGRWHAIRPAAHLAGHVQSGSSPTREPLDW